MEGDKVITMSHELLTQIVEEAYAEGYNDREYSTGSRADEYYWSNTKEYLEKLLSGPN